MKNKKEERGKKEVGRMEGTRINKLPALLAYACCYLPILKKLSVRNFKINFDTGKSFKPSPLGDGQSKALLSFSCLKNSKDKPTPLGVGKTQGVFDINNIWQKRIVSLFFIIFILIIISVNFISAAKLYWVGNNNGLWGNASNWASSSGGAGGAGVPNATNDVIFDSANLNNSIINETGFTGAVNSINISIGYNGTITSLAVGNVSWRCEEINLINSNILVLMKGGKNEV
jgi:hypothetical protein